MGNERPALPQITGRYHNCSMDGFENDVVAPGHLSVPTCLLPTCVWWLSPTQDAVKARLPSGISSTDQPGKTEFQRLHRSIRGRNSAGWPRKPANRPVESGMARYAAGKLSVMVGRKLIDDGPASTASITIRSERIASNHRVRGFSPGS
jgi:hypothetical protein